MCVVCLHVYFACLFVCGALGDNSKPFFFFFFVCICRFRYVTKKMRGGGNCGTVLVCFLIKANKRGPPPASGR